MKFQQVLRSTWQVLKREEQYLPSKLILATLVYLLSEAFNVTGLKCTVIASFCGVGLTLCKQSKYEALVNLPLLTHCAAFAYPSKWYNCN